MTAAVPDDLEPRRRDAQQRLERAVGEGRLTLRVWSLLGDVTVRSAG
ncbi:hypothetical protein GCM10023215_35150 [Pseudonocardia yuanmonensis]|uniref:Uncharacterized protein n=1 Tax=Pseudonocardia yuanmonensis TaxID=1095914 RepID=A0ABP8WW21_9PSEU